MGSNTKNKREKKQGRRSQTFKGMVVIKRKGKGSGSSSAAQRGEKKKRQGASVLLGKIHRDLYKKGTKEAFQKGGKKTLDRLWKKREKV